MGFFLIIIYETSLRFIEDTLTGNIHLFLMPFFTLIILYFFVLFKLSNFRK